VGERGWKVEKLHNPAELAAYHAAMKAPYLIQEYVDYPIELGLFYYRFPGCATGHISSVVIKAFLTLTGDGASTVRELIMGSDRARLQYQTLHDRYAPLFDRVLPAGEAIQLVPIGNHSRGTKFLNGNHLINDKLVAVFDRISQSLDGFYYGRYDIRCRSLAELYRAKASRSSNSTGPGPNRPTSTTRPFRAAKPTGCCSATGKCCTASAGPITATACNIYPLPKGWVPSASSERTANKCNSDGMDADGFRGGGVGELSGLAAAGYPQRHHCPACRATGHGAGFRFCGRLRGGGGRLQLPGHPAGHVADEAGPLPRGRRNLLDGAAAGGRGVLPA
jgi:hypothetical protein